jgi:hypothetical protein
MAQGGKSGGRFGSLVGLVQQWQVVVTAIAAATALWFGFADQRRKEVELNRAAVTAAKAATPADFALDPYAALAEFRVSYPEHAFCAALGTFLAEAARQAPTGDAAAVRRMSDAVGTQVDRIAGRGGLTLAQIEGLASAAAGDGSSQDACPDLRPRFGLRGRALGPDCRVLVETFAQVQCQTRAAEKRRASVAAEIGSGGAPAAEPPAPIPTESPAPAAEPSASAGPTGRMAAPGPFCGGTPPTVFVQFTGDRAAAERLRAELQAAGWSAPAVEAVTGARPRGDVRFYWPDQEACAAALAEALQAATGAEFITVSLAGRYRNLPRGRMEVWLPGG